MAEFAKMPFNWKTDMEKKMPTRVKVTPGGRIVIPSDVRQRLGIEVGTTLLMTVEDDYLKLTIAKVVRQKARQRVQRYLLKGTDLAEELIAEPTTEARNE